MLGRLYGIKMFGRLYGIFKAAKTHKAFKRPSALSPNTRLCHTWYYFNTVLDNISKQYLSAISTQYSTLFQHKTWYYFKAIVERSFNAIPGTISTQCTLYLMYFSYENQPFTTQYNVTCSNVSLTHIIQSNTHDDGGDLDGNDGGDIGGDLGAHFEEEW